MTEPENIIDKYIRNVSRMDKVNIDKLGNIISNNSWISYYCNCEAEIDGWIDFEREIYPVIDTFEFVFSCEYIMQGTVSGKVDVVIPKKELKVQHLIIVELWKKYFTVANKYVYLNESYISHNYGILKKRILDDLKREFDEFIYAFEIYLHEFIYRNDDVKPLKQIRELDINNVISFNYTLTEKLYGIDETNVHHLQGMIREDIKQGKNNMVMGVSESVEQNMDFIYYVKYFQRIQKASGTRYKELIKKKYSRKEVGYDRYSLHIYGHSLDETDEDIITFLIGSKKKLKISQMNPQHVTIYYYDSTDYEQKVINLIKIYGRKIVELYMERNWFEFVPISTEEISD